VKIQIRENKCIASELDLGYENTAFNWNSRGHDVVGRQTRDDLDHFAADSDGPELYATRV
jgi:hypothetical protein